MYELIQVSNNSYYIQSPTKIGLVRLNDTDVCLIDSGNDKDAGKKVQQIIDANGWHLDTIFNTHSHADHVGGNNYLQNKTGCKIYARGIECNFTRYPILEPSLLYGGFPPKDLCHKFLLAKESDASVFSVDVLHQGLQIIELPGHSFDMVGFRSADDVVYLADCLSSKKTLDKYQISFVYNVAAYLDTLETVKKMQAKMFVPAHAEATDNILPLAQINIEKVNEIAQTIVRLCKEPIIFEKLLQKLFTKYNLVMNFEQYALVGSTVRSYLAWLKDTGRITAFFEDNTLLWQSV